MNDTFDFDNSIIRKNSSKDKVKFAILGNRLGMTHENAKLLMKDLTKETAKTFFLPEIDVNSDIDFSGREFDFVFTISKQDIPDNKI